MQSLYLFLEEKKTDFGFRVSLENFSEMEKVKIYPLYAIKNLLQSWFQLQLIAVVKNPIYVCYQKLSLLKETLISVDLSRKQVNNIQWMLLILNHWHLLREVF